MTAFSIAQGVAKAVGRGLTAPGSGGGGPLPIPAGFDWTPPVSVFRSSDGVYSTDYDPTPFLVEGDPGVTTFYVDGDTGSDANPGTAVSPKKSLVPISGGRVNKLLIKARGTFYGGYTSPVQVGHDELCVEAWDGAYCAITTLPSPTAPFVWTDEGGGVWSAPPMFSGFNGINPYAGTDIETLQKYPLAASLAACQATPGTHFRETVPSIKHYVHTLDGTSPATGHTIFGNVIAAQSFSTAAFAFNQRLAFHGITFMGGPTAFNVLGTTALQKRVDFVNCAFKHAGSFGALQATGNALVISYESSAGPSVFDGFSYTTASGAAGTEVPSAVEINCTGYNNGFVNTGANQGSTTHFGGKLLRVNGTYQGNGDDQIADVGTDTHSWNLGCTFGPRGEPSGDAGARAGNGVGNTTLWLDGCTFDTVSFDVAADPAGSTVYYKNMAAPGLKTGSTGTVTTY